MRRAGLQYRRMAQGTTERVALPPGLLMAAALAAAMASGRAWLFIPVELALSLGFFMLHSVLQARATEMLPQARATAVATFACLLFLGQSVGALLMGAPIARFGYKAAFLLDAGAIVALTLWLARMLRRGPA